MSEQVKYEDADLYDCEGSHYYHERTPEGAIVSFYENSYNSIESSLLDFIKSTTPLTVHAFKHEDFSETFIDGAVKQMSRTFLGDLEDLYASSDYAHEDYPLELSDEELSDITEKIKLAVQAYFRCATSYRCIKVAEKTYSSEEVLSILEGKEDE